MASADDGNAVGAAIPGSTAAAAAFAVADDDVTAVSDEKETTGGAGWPGLGCRGGGGCDEVPAQLLGAPACWRLQKDCHSPRSRSNALQFTSTAVIRFTCQTLLEFPQTICMRAGHVHLIDMVMGMIT